MRVQTINPNVDFRRNRAHEAQDVVQKTVIYAPKLTEKTEDPLGRIKKQHIMRLFFSLKVVEKHMNEDDKDQILYALAKNMVTSNFLSDEEQEKIYQKAIRLQYFS